MVASTSPEFRARIASPWHRSWLSSLQTSWISQRLFPPDSRHGLRILLCLAVQASGDNRSEIYVVAILRLGTDILSEVEQDKYSVLRIAIENCSELSASGKKGNNLAHLGAIKEEWFTVVSLAGAKWWE